MLFPEVIEEICCMVTESAGSGRSPDYSCLMISTVLDIEENNNRVGSTRSLSTQLISEDSEGMFTDFMVSDPISFVDWLEGMMNGITDDCFVVTANKSTEFSFEVLANAVEEIRFRNTGVTAVLTLSHVHIPPPIKYRIILNHFPLSLQHPKIISTLTNILSYTEV